jgi:quercetin dioxygenase-like cupin family protein
MRIVSSTDLPPFDPDRFVAQSLVEGRTCSVRIIRLDVGQSLPPHTHGDSDLMFLVLEGEAALDGPDGPVALSAGSIAHLSGDEELRASNGGPVGMTAIAFLSPPFPPRD